MQSACVLSRISFAILLLVAALCLPAHAQDSRDFAVMLRAETGKTPKPYITLHWNSDSFATGYTIERKMVSETKWEFLGDPGADAVEFTDEQVEPGKGYEYAVRKMCAQAITPDSALEYHGTGYIYAGIDILPPDKIGTVLLLVDNTMATPLSAELKQLENDLINEGWNVVRRDVARTETFSGEAVKQVKAVITSEYSAAPTELKSVFIIGRVAVPYSGRLAPDGHPEHVGAWPADSYYADMDGTWTDNKINDDTTELGRQENRNIIGDGKFDQTSIPSLLELQLGRVDFYNMSDLTTSETELLRRYLNKDHRYRTGQIAVRAGGIVDDNFSAVNYAEAFASSGWRNIALFGGASEVKAADWFTTLDTASYLWAYGCGPGAYSSSAGVCFTAQFNTISVDAIFTMLFGSYFGDWDSPNNLLRAQLASEPSTLTSVWAARPHWYFHHMLMGENIGFSAVVSQNNSSTYIPNYNFNVPGYPNGIAYTVGNRQIHAALLGDPTLRVYKGAVVAKMETLTASQIASAQPLVKLNWSSPSDLVDGYQIFRSTAGEPLALLTDSIITGTEFIDDKVSINTYTYMVRAVVRRHSNGGTYFDAGTGMVAGLGVTDVGEENGAPPALACYPNPASQLAMFSFPVEKHSAVVVDMYNATGAHITRLSAEKPAGQQNVVWNLADANGQRVAPGVYTVRCSINGNIATTRVVVLP